MSVSDLDNLAKMKEIDTKGMLGLVLEFPEQCQRAADIVKEWTPGIKIGDELDAIVVSGLGGSAISGDMVAALRAKDLKVPMVTNRDYTLPNFITNNSLVICESYSGNTEETLASYADARKRGARIVCITSGGKLAEMAKNDGVDVITVPGGQPPRSATGYMFIPMMFVLEKLGIVPPISGQLPDALELLKKSREEWKPEVASDDNECKLLAREMYERIPIIYGSTGITGVIAFRWKSQFNENAKVHAFWNSFPELNHNEIMGWELASLESEQFAAIFIRDPEDKSRIADRIRITSTLIPRGFMTRDIQLQGKNCLEKLLWGFYLGDLASVYLAFCYNIDPTKITGIDRLKEELAKIP
ncbi:MAG TPA: bifunctional phosphoglucose/phosphomannose isomerase [Armatimonadota bacterium]|nr:bifunctional phosphoglucose/phosphomannose isomerase [Armatimonadota bacterium]